MPATANLREGTAGSLQPLQPRGRDDVWVVGPDLVVRTAALPTAIVHRLRCPHTAAEIHQLLESARQLEEEADELRGALYTLIPTLDDSLRGRAMGLRRALHRNKSVTGSMRALDAALPEPLKDRIVRWEDHRTQHGRRDAALPALLAAELVDRRAELRRLAADPVFRQGLASSRPSLLHAVSPWLDGTRERPPQRRTLLRLSNYLVRTAAKTSPRSSFTTLGLGEWTGLSLPSAEAPLAETSPAPKLTVQPHALLLGAVITAVARHQGLRHVVRLRLNPGRMADGDRLWWLTPTATSPLVGARLTGPARTLLAVAAQGTHSLTELVDRLVDESHHTEEPIELSQAVEFVESLVQAQLLLPVPPVPDQSDDQLADLLHWLDRVHEGPGLPESLRGVRADLADAHRRLTRLADDRLDAERWPAEREAFETSLRAAAVTLGVLSTGDELPDATGVYDHRVVTGPAARLPVDEWTPLLDDLNLVRRMLALFDPKLPFQLELGRLFAETYGPDAHVPYLEFFRACHLPGEEADRLRRLHALRVMLSPEQEQAALDAFGESASEHLVEVMALRAALVADFNAQRPDPDGVVRPPLDALHKRIGHWPGYLSAPGSITAYLQQHAPGRAVLNGVDTGYGHGLARVRRLVHGGRGPLPQPDRKRVPDEPLLAEWDHVFGSTLNVRRAAVPYTIDYPGLVADRPADRILPLHELTVTYDLAYGRLRLCAPAHGPVQPVYTGGNWEVLLPPAARFLMDGFAEPPMFLAPQSWWLNEPIRELPAEVRHLPRLELGRLTVRRALWAVRAGSVPQREVGEGDAAFMLRFTAWLRGHSIPDRCFVRVLEPGAGRVVARSKPMPLDAGNWFLLTAFEGRLGDADDLVLFTEELPELSGDEGRHVQELMVELGDPAVHRG
ncbi:lantibiotic dehydratase [Streptomyces sp. NPDC088752]|uniref:lantibiotic dehydratase n=1 Tax=Streptomyces sp. NPDC088752 TaxID=3154963 RepID=UPI00343457DE